jgi:hypothetical protein
MDDKDQNTKIDLNSNDDSQLDLEKQLDQAAAAGGENPEVSTRKELTSKDSEGAAPDLGTAKDQMNQEDGIEIL